MKFTVFLALAATASAIKITSEDYFKAKDIGTGSLDKKYERVPPPNFSADSDDLFMKSMIMKYLWRAKMTMVHQLEPSSWMKPPPEPPPPKFLEPIRDSRELILRTTLRPTSQEPGHTLTSTKQALSVLRSCHNS